MKKSERKFECKICFRKLLTNSQLSSHALSHLKRFQCDYCGYLSAYKRNVMVHMNLHIAQNQYKCLVCWKLFENRESFRFHSHQAHKDLKNPIGLTKADLSCGTCGKEFEDVPKRRRHEISHKENVQCPICDKICSASNLKKHLKLHKMKDQGKYFSCDICGYKNTYKYVLKDHLEVHFNPEIAECKICWKKFTNTKTLKRHSRTIHNLNVKPSKLYCNICQKKLPNLSALTSHKIIHKAPKICPVCSKSIVAKNISKHMKLHELKKKLKTKPNLRNHKQTHFMSRSNLFLQN